MKPYTHRHARGYGRMLYSYFLNFSRESSWSQQARNAIASFQREMIVRRSSSTLGAFAATTRGFDPTTRARLFKSTVNGAVPRVKLQVTHYSV